MILTQLLRSIYYKEALNQKVEMDLIKEHSPNDLDYKILKENRESYWIVNNKNRFIEKAEKLGILDFCQEIHRIYKKGDKYKTETDDFYEKADQEGVWYILNFSQNQMEKREQVQRICEWKLLTDLLSSWSSRYCMSFRKFAKIRRKDLQSWGIPENTGGEPLKRRPKLEDSRYDQRKKDYLEWGIEKPEKEKERIQSLLAELKIGLWNKFGLQDLNLISEAQREQLCTLVQNLQNHGIWVSDVNTLLQMEQPIRAFGTFGRLLENIQEDKKGKPRKQQMEEYIAEPWQKDTVQENVPQNTEFLDRREELLERLEVLLDKFEGYLPEQQRSFGIGSFRLFCKEKSSAIKLNKELEENIGKIYRKVQARNGEREFAQMRIQEQKESGYCCNRAAPNDSLVQIECLVALVQEGVITEEMLINDILRYEKEVKSELKELFIMDKVGKDAFPEEKINLTDCVYRLDTEAITRGLREIYTGKHK